MFWRSSKKIAQLEQALKESEDARVRLMEIMNDMEREVKTHKDNDLELRVMKMYHDGDDELVKLLEDVKEMEKLRERIRYLEENQGYLSAMGMGQQSLGIQTQSEQLRAIGASQSQGQHAAALALNHSPLGKVFWG